MEKVKDGNIDEYVILIHYAANLCDSERVSRVFGIGDSSVLVGILGDFQREWDDLEIDEYGATVEQAAELDAIVDKYRDLIKGIKQIIK